MTGLKARLDQIRARVTSNDFLTGKGLGNEVPFYAFDYAPADEPQVDAYVSWLADDLGRKTSLNIVNVNVFSLVVDLLRARGLYEKAVALELAKGSAIICKLGSSVKRDGLPTRCGQRSKISNNASHDAG